MTTRSALFAVALLSPWLAACHFPPPDKTLEVRNLASKCALVRFSSCPEEPLPETDDAGAEDDAGRPN